MWNRIYDDIVTRYTTEIAQLEAEADARFDRLQNQADCQPALDSEKQEQINAEDDYNQFKEGR